MPERRITLPGAAELFRATDDPDVPAPDSGDAETQAKGTGRMRHGEKITVYLSSDELMELEKARLELRGSYACPVDRGRIVREAIAMALAELAHNGEESELLAGLRAS